MGRTVDLTQTISLPGTRDRKQLALIREKFLDEDTAFIQKCLIEDLRKFVDAADISRMKMITLDFFLPAFLDKICNVYDNAPVLKFTDKQSNDSDSLNDLLNETRFFLMLQDNFAKLRLHGTVVPYVRYNKNLDKIWVDLSLNESSATVLTYPGYSKEPIIVAYPIVNGKNVIYYVWEKETGNHYYVKDKLKLNDNGTQVINKDKFPVGDNKDLKGPDYWPFVDYHYRLSHTSFWGNGLDSVIELIRAINLLLTVVTDDTIQETIRILILNFDPRGEKGEKGQIKTGMRHPLFRETGFDSSSDPTGSILSAPLYNDDVIKLIENLTNIVSNVHSIDNIIKESIKSNLSGIAIKLKSEPLLQRWAKDINIVRYYDMKLIETLITVHNYHRAGKAGHRKIPDSLIKGLTLDYQKPNMVADEKADYELEKEKWSDGTSSPVLYMMQRNPELSRDEAKERLKSNLEETKDIFKAMEITIESPDLEDNLNLGNK